MYQGADPGAGWQMTDPIYGKTPTLGSCQPQIRRAVEKGDFIFSISGRMNKLQQYVVGGFEVDQKIHQLAAYERFPENRMVVSPQGLSGNIIIDKNGEQLPIDYHTNFQNRIDNYIIGCNPVVIESPDEVEKGRQQTIEVLNSIFSKREDSVFKIIGRCRKLDDQQVKDLVSWLEHLKMQ
jgi:hypothetical protein